MFKNTEHLLIIMLIALNIADIITTYAGLSFLGLSETNTMVTFTFNQVGFIFSSVMKMLVVFLLVSVIFLSNKTQKTEHQKLWIHRFLLVLLISLDLFFCFVVFNNLAAILINL
jgi:uncharacterized membrane protein